MAGKEIRQGGKKNRKWGRNKIKCARYAMHNQRAKNKVIKIWRSAGMKTAMDYAEEHNIYSFAKERLKNARKREQPVHPPTP